MSSTAAIQIPQIPQIIINMLLQLMARDELVDLLDQFNHIWSANKQLLWTGLRREAAQSFADKYGLQTLTTAMGPFMDRNDPRCLYATKSTKAWSEYIKGASALFAFYISKGDMVLVLSPTPPNRFHPSGCTNFQLIEKPILQGKLGNRAVGRIMLIHPMVHGAEATAYQAWPTNNTSKWQEIFGNERAAPVRWRKVKPNSNAAIRAAKQAWKPKRAHTETLEEKLARQKAHAHKARTDRARKASIQEQKRRAHEMKVQRDQARKVAKERALEQSLSFQHSEPWSPAKIFARRGLTQKDLDDLGVLEVHDDFFCVLWEDQILVFVSSFLTFGEIHIICQQFDRVWRPDKQVLWNGVEGFRHVVQKWANKNGLQTMTTVMGSLLDKSNPSYGKSGSNKRSNYMKGASALFAWYISKGDKVIVLALPPDENGDRFNPSPYTNYRGIEEPIVKGQLGNRAVGEMLILHPTVPGADKFFYPLWPMDGQKAMKAILDTSGRGIWSWRTPSLSQKAQARLDSIIPQSSSSAEECVISGMTINMEQGGTGSSIHVAPKVMLSTPIPNNQKAIQQGTVERPATPSSCPQLGQKILAEGDIVLWLGNRDKIKRVCAALRLVLAADEIGLQRAKGKLELLLEEVYWLQKEKVWRHKATAKGSSERSPDVTVESAPRTKKPEQKDCSKSRQESPNLTSSCREGIVALSKAQKVKEKKKRNKEGKKRKEMAKQKEGKAAEDSTVNFSMAEIEREKKERKTERKKEKNKKRKEQERKQKEDTERLSVDNSAVNLFMAEMEKQRNEGREIEKQKKTTEEENKQEEENRKYKERKTDEDSAVDMPKPERENDGGEVGDEEQGTRKNRTVNKQDTSRGCCAVM
uniref:Uncharacterized protein n=1 Tax=Pyricularia oryzae (strain P131) TaxID=1143193 RepID=L7JJU7_PYRO1